MKPSLSRDHLLVSIAAGIPIEKLQVGCYVKYFALLQILSEGTILSLVGELMLYDFVSLFLYIEPFCIL